MSISFSEILTMLDARPSLPFTHALATDSVAAHVTAWHNTDRLDIKRPRVALYASNYGTLPAQKAQKTITSLASGNHAISRLTALSDADLRVYELDLTQSHAPLNEEAAAHAISYGMMAIEEGCNLLVLGSLSAADTDLLSDLTNKLKAATDKDLILPLLASHGATDLCAMLGAVMAARMATIPVLAAQDMAQILNAALISLCGGQAQETPLIAAPDFMAKDTTLAPIWALYQLRGLAAIEEPEDTSKPLIRLSATK